MEKKWRFPVWRIIFLCRKFGKSEGIRKESGYFRCKNSLFQNVEIYTLKAVIKRRMEISAAKTRFIL